MDRNPVGAGSLITLGGSLSARRAWIEMPDRTHRLGLFRSLSARRAWIEITVVGVLATLVTVALRKESVDRNYQANAVDQILPGRSPQGERG